MEKLLVVTALDSMDVPAHFDGLIPVHFSSKSELHKSILEAAAQYKQKIKDLDLIKPSESEQAIFESTFDMEEDDVLADPSLKDAYLKAANFYEKYNDLCLNCVLYDFNGTKIDITIFIEETLTDITIFDPVIMTMDEWFDSRLKVFSELS